MPLGPLPSLGPFGRVVDVRVYPHGFTTQQTADAGPAGSAIVRPNLENDAWHAAGSPKYGGNILWTGSTPRHTIAYNGPRGRWFGPILAGGVYCYSSWLAYNGAKIDAPAGAYVLGAAIHEYDGLADVTYTGAGDSALTMDDPPTAATAVTGAYTLRCTVGGGVGAQFVLRRPDDTPIAALVLADVPLVFDGELRFTLTAGALPHAVGDEWQIEVEEPTQIVAVVSSAPGAGATETLYRRGVSLLGAWKVAGTIPPAAGQSGGSLQPWFFNAAGTLAVTCRGLGAGADGLTLGTCARTLTVATGAVADSVEAAAPRTYTAVYTCTAADAGGATAFTDVAASNSTGPVRQLMALDFDGDTAVRVEIEFDGYLDGNSSMTEDDGSFPDQQGYATLSATYSAWADWVVTGGVETRLRVFDLTATATLTQTAWPVYNVTLNANENITARTLRDVADAQAARHGYTEFVGPQTVAGDFNDVVTSNGGAALAHYVAGSAVATAGGTVENHSGTGGVPPSEFANLIYQPGSPEYSYTSPQVVDTRTLPCIGVGALGAAWTVRQFLAAAGPQAHTIATGGLPAVGGSPARGHHTSATDARGNWLMAAEVAAPAASFWPGSFPGSGTYTDATGGPDSLTPATVASLTAHPGDDRWNIGVF